MLNIRHSLLGSLIVLAALSSSGDIASAQNNPFEAGNAMYSSGDFRGALQQYQQVLRLKASYWPARYQLANCYFRMNDYKEANYHYRLCLASGPDNETAMRCLEAMRTTAELHNSQRRRPVPQLSTVRPSQPTVTVDAQKKQIIADVIRQVQSLDQETQQRANQLLQKPEYQTVNADGQMTASLPQNVRDQLKREFADKATRAIDSARVKFEGAKSPASANAFYVHSY